MEKMKASRKFSIMNTMKTSTSIVFEPWLTEIRLDFNDEVVVEVSCDELEHDDDPMPSLWLGRDGVSVYTNCKNEKIKAWKNGIEIPDLTYKV